MSDMNLSVSDGKQNKKDTNVCKDDKNNKKQKKVDCRLPIITITICYKIIYI